MGDNFLHLFWLHAAAEFITESNKKRSERSEFYWSQFYGGLNDDKKGIGALMKKEKENERKSIHFLWRAFSRLSKSYEFLDSYVPFQYLVELFDRYHEEFWIPQESLKYLHDWLDDLILSIRGAMSGHYRSGYFHLRSFIENYFELVWTYCEANHFLNEDKLKSYRTGSITPRMRYFSTFWKYNKENTDNRFSLDFYFHGYEMEKLYNIISESVHVKNNTGKDYSVNLDFNEQELDEFCRVWGITLIMVSRMLYGFFAHKVEQYWLEPLLKPVPYEMNYYRYVIWSLMRNDIWIFNLLYERPRDRKFFLWEQSKYKFDIQNFYFGATDKMQDYDMIDEISKETGDDKEAYAERYIAYLKNKDLERRNIQKE